MGKRVYLHVGWEKTGSSAIQVFGARNQKWLNKHGIHYPLMGTLPQHVALYRDLKKGYTSLMRRSRDAIRAQIDACEHDAMIFSHESLHSCSPAMFADIFDGCDVRIIAYTRRPDAAMISFFVTMARFGQMPVHNLHKCIRMFAKSNLGHFDYYWSLRGFVSEFGRDAISVRHYDRNEMVGGQTVSDFMHVLGIDDLSGSKWPEDQANLSLDADQFAIVLGFAKTLKGTPPGKISNLGRLISNAMIHNTSPDRERSVERFVPVSLRKRLLACWQDSFDTLYDEFFDGRRVFDDDSWIQRTETYAGMSTKRAKELAKIVRKAKVIPDEHRDGICDVIDQLTQEEPATSLVWS